MRDGMARRVITTEPGAKERSDAAPGTGAQTTGRPEGSRQAFLATLQAAGILPLVPPGAVGPGLCSHDPSGRSRQAKNPPNTSPWPGGSSQRSPGPRSTATRPRGQEPRPQGGPKGRDKPFSRPCRPPGSSRWSHPGPWAPGFVLTTLRAVLAPARLGITPPRGPGKGQKKTGVTPSSPRSVWCHGPRGPGSPQKSFSSGDGAAPGPGRRCRAAPRCPVPGRRCLRRESRGRCRRSPPTRR